MDLHSASAIVDHYTGPLLTFSTNILFQDMTFESTDTCMKILELLCTKMEDPSAVVKYKALNVVKQVLQKGSTAFSREMGRKQAVIRDCMNFRGPPDPLRGDAPYSQVRELAQQVINMVYDTEVTTQTPPAFALNTTFPPTSENGRNFQQNSANGNFHPSGFGSGSIQPSSNYKVSTTITEGGNGNNNGRGPRAMGVWVEHKPSTWDTMMEAVVDGIGSLATSASGSQPSSNTHPRNIYGGGSSAASGRNLGFEPKYTTGDVSSLDYDGDESGNQRYTASTSTSATSDSISLSADLPGLSKSLKAITDSLEYRTVNEIALNGGKRSFLSRTEISAFVGRVRNAPDSRPLVECLLVRIFILDSNWIPSVNALGLLDAILKNQISNAFAAVQPHVSALLRLSSRSVQTAIQEKVSSILQNFPEELAKVNTAAPSPSPMIDAHTSSEDSIFSGLHTKSHSQPQLIEHDDFSFLGAPTSTKATASSVNLIDDGPIFHNPAPSASESIFDGLSFESSSSAASVAPIPSHASATHLEPSLLDFTPTYSATPDRDVTNSAQLGGANSSLDFLLADRPSRGLEPSSTATLGQMQNSSPLLFTNVPSSADNQLAILRGQRAAIVDQIQLLRLQTLTPQRSDIEEKMAAQLKAIDTALADLERTSKTSTYTGGSASLESIYRQQQTSSASPSIDYSALQTSHPVDPFDALRHDMRK